MKFTNGLEIRRIDLALPLLSASDGTCGSTTLDIAAPYYDTTA